MRKKRKPHVASLYHMRESLFVAVNMRFRVLQYKMPASMPAILRPMAMCPLAEG